MPTKNLRSFHDNDNSKEYIILKNLWYAGKDEVNGEAVLNANNIDLLTNPFTECSNNIRSLRTDPENGFLKVDGNVYNISYEGVRVPKNNEFTTVNSPTFKETFVINTPTGNISGASVYADASTGSITSIDTTEWIVYGGTGEYKEANYATITYDNDGFRFGYPYARRIRIMKVIDKDPEPEPES